MKTIQKLLFLALLYQFSPSWLVAQSRVPVKSTTPDKPFLYSNLPEKFGCSTITLRQLFLANLNDSVSIPFPGGRPFKGVVSAKVQRDAAVLSLNIFSTNYPGTLLNISLVTQEDNSEKMTGRFLNLRSSDAMTLEFENNRYFIKKDLQKFVMSECPLPEMIDYSTSN